MTPQLQVIRVYKGQAVGMTMLSHGKFDGYLLVFSLNRSVARFITDGKKDR